MRPQSSSTKSEWVKRCRAVTFSVMRLEVDPPAQPPIETHEQLEGVLSMFDFGVVVTFQRQ